MTSILLPVKEDTCQSSKQTRYGYFHKLIKEKKELFLVLLQHIFSISAEKKTQNKLFERYLKLMQPCSK